MPQQEPPPPGLEAMDVLVVSDKIPSYRLGDGLRLYSLLRHLPKHRFDLLCFLRPGEVIGEEARSAFGKISTVPFPVAPPSSGALRTLGALSLRNFKASSDEMRSLVAAELASGRYDLVVDLAANMLLALPAGPLPVPLVVDSIDEPLLRDLRALRHSSPSAWPRLLRQLLMFWRYERHLLKTATTNIFASELDARFYRAAFPGRRVAVVPNGVDSDYFAPAPGGIYAEADSDTVVFEGNMMFGPNVDAARRLCKQVLPRLKALRPSARVVLVGRDPAPEVCALEGPDVQVTGTVDDVRPFLLRAGVFACPMRLGSGIKNKILQAWSCGVPVVATTASLGGLGARNGQNLLVRDEIQAFAEALAEVMRNRQLAATLAREGRRTIDSNFSWRQCASAFEAVLIDAVESDRLKSNRSRSLHSAE